MQLTKTSTNSKLKLLNSGLDKWYELHVHVCKKKNKPLNGLTIVPCKIRTRPAGLEV